MTVVINHFKFYFFLDLQMKDLKKSLATLTARSIPKQFLIVLEYLTG